MFGCEHEGGLTGITAEDLRINIVWAPQFVLKTNEDGCLLEEDGEASKSFELLLVVFVPMTHGAVR